MLYSFLLGVQFWYLFLLFWQSRVLVISWVWSVCDSVCDILRGLFGVLFLFFSQYKYSLYWLLFNIMSMKNDKYQDSRTIASWANHKWGVPDLWLLLITDLHNLVQFIYLYWQVLSLPILWQKFSSPFFMLQKFNFKNGFIYKLYICHHFHRWWFHGAAEGRN
jgi:hypothetical protein